MFRDEFENGLRQRQLGTEIQSIAVRCTDRHVFTVIQNDFFRLEHRLKLLAQFHAFNAISTGAPYSANKFVVFVVNSPTTSAGVFLNETEDG